MDQYTEQTELLQPTAEKDWNNEEHTQLPDTLEQELQQSSLLFGLLLVFCTASAFRTDNNTDEALIYPFPAKTKLFRVLAAVHSNIN